MSTIQDYKLLTIIIPTYNRCREVKENIEITLPQILEHKDKVRLYISDNASTDDTEKMIEKYTDQYPDLVFYYRQPKNITASPNFNHAVHAVNSDYVHILGDDDLLMPFTISVFLDLIEKNPQIGVFHFNYILGINDLEKCCLLYPQIGTSMMKYYPSGKEFIYDKLSGPSFISSSLIKREVWLYGSQFTTEDCAGYVWLSTMYFGCLEYPCMTYEVPLLIQRCPKAAPYAKNWPLYHVFGISQLFWYLDEYIKGVYQHWMDIQQGKYKYRTWQTILSCSKEKEFYKRNKDRMLRHLQGMDSKFIFKASIMYLPTWVNIKLIIPICRVWSFVKSRL